MTNWEGGVRTPAFISGGFGPATSVNAGKVLPGIFHICDWLVTFLDLAGIPPTLEPNAPVGLDGISQWCVLILSSTFAAFFIMLV